MSPASGGVANQSQPEHRPILGVAPVSHSPPPQNSSSRSSSSCQSLRPRLGRQALLSLTRDTAPTGTKPRIAILPFANLSPDPTDVFFADGMHEEITSTLANRVAALEVVPRTTMMTYRAREVPIGRIAGDLDADYILEGSVRRDGTSVRLTIQLVDAASQRYLWSRNYDRPLGDALSLQSEVAAEVASRLAIPFGAGHRGSMAPTSNPEAYDAYLKARLFYRDGDWSAAAAMASEAIEHDPTFGLAYITRAAAHDMQIVFNLDTSEERLKEQYRDLQHARRLLGDSDPLVLSGQAMFLAIADRDYQRSLAMFAAAEAAGLTDPAALRTRAMQLVVMDRLDDAIVSHQSLAALDPGNFVLVNNMAVLLSLARRSTEAMLVSNLVVDRFPGNAVAELTQARLVFAQTGRTDRWRSAYEKRSRAMNGDRRVMEGFDLLRYERRFAELRNVLQAESAETVSAGTFNSLTLCCVGNRPTAEYRGWAALLSNDPEGAKREGRKVLSHAASERTTRWNDWYLRLLQAEGLLMTGDHRQALIAARAALALVPRSKNAINWRYAAAVAARVFAWGGAPEEAVATLAALDSARPGLRTAEIVHDPLYGVPLEKQPRYRSLRARLEREMHALEHR